MASAQGLFNNCIYRHGGFRLSATSSCPAISQMSSTLSSQPAKRSRWKMETLQQAISLVKIMLNLQSTWMPHRSHDMYIFMLDTFRGLPVIFINLCADGDVSIEVISVRSVRVSHGFLLFMWKARVSFPECVCDSSCTLSQALTIAPSSLAPCNPFYRPPPLSNLFLPQLHCNKLPR